ncbi:hypothetical protein DTQ70_11130 [Runella sp. SP2]|nr:hypothetical protein DTQ70_11130 [Runella sp. SP2]
MSCANTVMQKQSAKQLSTQIFFPKIGGRVCNISTEWLIVRMKKNLIISGHKVRMWILPHD